MTASVSERWSALVTRVLAPNPGPMTLEGTNSLVVGAPDRLGVVVIDPGPDDDGHLRRLQEHGAVELILLTHRHRDHTESAARLAAQTGAAVRAIEPALCVAGAPLADGERIEAGGTFIDVVATPGHTADSASFHLPGDAAPTGPRGGGTMVTGDTILGRGTTIIARPDGSLAAYLRTLERLARYGAIPALPAHGPFLPDLAAVCARYTAHRESRLDDVRAVLRSLGREASVDPALIAAVVDAVYTKIEPAVRFAAEASVQAQLEYLAESARTGG